MCRGDVDKRDMGPLRPRVGGVLWGGGGGGVAGVAAGWVIQSAGLRSRSLWTLPSSSKWVSDMLI